MAKNKFRASDRIKHASALPYNIDVHGSLKINSVKITSWDPTTNNYAITNGSREAVPTGTKGATTNGYIIHFGAREHLSKLNMMQRALQI